LPANITVICTHRAKRQYWEELEPASGRPYSSAFSHPDNWGVTAVSHRLFYSFQQMLITSAKEVMFYKAFVCLSVCPYVCLFAC